MTTNERKWHKTCLKNERDDDDDDDDDTKIISPM